MGKEEGRINYLKSLLENNMPTVVILLEIKPDVFVKIKESFPGFNVAYSLDIRRPGTHEGGNRQLGVMVLASSHFQIEKKEVLDRNIFPERSLSCKLDYNGDPITVLGIHSITGCGYKRAKTAQFLSLADYVASEKYDVIFIDANEPDIEGLEQKDNVYFSQINDNGIGARTFFDTLEKHNYFDCYRDICHIKNYVRGKPLTISHIIQNSKKERRYDFLFRKDNWKTVSAKYDYDNAVAAGSDHASILAILENNK